MEAIDYVVVADDKTAVDPSVGENISVFRYLDPNYNSLESIKNEIKKVPVFVKEYVMKEYGSLKKKYGFLKRKISPTNIRNAYIDLKNQGEYLKKNLLQTVIQKKKYQPLKYI